MRVTLLFGRARGPFLALVLILILGILLPLQAFAMCGFDSHGDYRCDAMQQTMTQTALQTVVNVPGITAGGSIGRPIMMPAATDTTPGSSATQAMQQQFQQLAQLLQQNGIALNIIQAMMQPMTLQQQQAFLSVVAAMTAVQVISTFGAG